MSVFGVTAKDVMLSRGDLRLIGRTIQAMKVHGEADTLTFEGREWHTVSSEIDWANKSQSEWVLLGSSRYQENLYFDENAEFIQQFKEIAVETCEGKPIAEVLNSVNAMINCLTALPGLTRAQVEDTLDERLEAYIKAKRRFKRPHQFLDIHFEELAAAKLLVCRHKGLLAASVIGHLINKGVLPPGTAREYRSTIIDNNQKLLGAHLWSVYTENSNGTLWICDPRCDNVMNVNSEYDSVAATYGQLATNDMIKRLSTIEAKRRFVESLDLLEKAFIQTSPTMGKLIVLQVVDKETSAKLEDYLKFDGIHTEMSEAFPNMIVIKEYDNPKKFSHYEKILLNNHGFEEQQGTKIFTFREIQSAPIAAPSQSTPIKPIVSAFDKARAAMPLKREVGNYHLPKMSMR